MVEVMVAEKARHRQSRLKYAATLNNHRKIPFALPPLNQSLPAQKENIA